MSSPAELNYDIKLNSNAAVAALQRFDAAAGNLMRRMALVGQGAVTAAGSMSGWMGAATKMAATSGAAAAAVGVLSAAMFGLAASLKQAAQFKQTTIAFKTLTGSAEAAKKVMAELSSMAIETPFQEGQLQGAAKAMLAARVPAEALKGELLAMGNIAAATGADIERLSIVYAQVAGKGKLYAEELQQFVEQGAGELRQAVATSLGVTTAQLGDMMQKGQVGFSDLQAAIQSLAGAGGKWGQAMAEQSRTTLGLMSSLWDSTNKVLRLVAQPINDGPLKSFLSAAVETATQASAVIEQSIAQNKVGETLKNTITLGAKLGVNALLDYFESLPRRMAGTLKRISDAVKLALTGSFDAAKKMLASFDLKKLRFDTSNEQDYFKNLVNGAKAAEQATKTIAAQTQGTAAPAAPAGSDWAKKLDAKTEDEKKKGQDMDSAERGRKAADMAAARNDALGELEILRAQVRGNQAKADAIDRALRVQKYALEYQKQLGASEEQALKLARERAALEDKMNGKSSRIGGVRNKRMMGEDIGPLSTSSGPLSKSGPLTPGGGLEGFDALQRKSRELRGSVWDEFSRTGESLMDYTKDSGSRMSERMNGTLPGKGDSKKEETTENPILAELTKVTAELKRIRTA